jgi:hypothetical protein
MKMTLEEHVSAKLMELRIRLEVHFDLCTFHEQQHGPDVQPVPLSIDLLAAIDLLQMLEGGAWNTVKEAIAAWEQRGDRGKPGPKAL